MTKLFLAALILFAIVHPTAVHAAKNGDVDMDQVDGISSKVVDELWKYTDFYWHHGDSSRIIGLDRLIAEVDPNFVPCYSTGAWIMESEGDVRTAEAFYQLAVQNNPNDSLAYYTLGAFYYQTLHDYGAAAYVFGLDVRTPDASVNDWKMLAHSYEKNSNLGLAVRTWKYIRQHWPNGPAVELNYQRIMSNPAAMQASVEIDPSKQ
jgi:tetratricopeptide (TPR) repeat protein